MVTEPTTVSGGETKPQSVPRARALDIQRLRMGWEGSRREIGVLEGEGKREDTLGGTGRWPTVGYLTTPSLSVYYGRMMAPHAASWMRCCKCFACTGEQ